MALGSLQGSSGSAQPSSIDVGGAAAFAVAGIEVHASRRAERQAGRGIEALKVVVAVERAGPPPGWMRSRLLIDVRL